MYVQMERIIIFNFKSFRGKVVIGPIKPFTGIIGANGSGKSNVMDAISFVMGEKATRLRVVIAEYYMSELGKLNLNIKAKNFLIFQGAIDSTVMKTPKEYTHMFEEISNSIELKEPYERLKNEIFEAQNETQYLYKSKKDLLLKKRDALSEKKEADKYTEIYNQHNTEQELVKVENDLKKKETKFTQIVEKALYWEQKINSTNLLLLEARKSHNSHIKTIKELESELIQVENIRTVFEENATTQILSQGSSIALNDTQDSIWRDNVEEYFHLKEIVGIQSYENVQACNSLKREQSVNQNKLDNENRKKFEFEAKLQQKNILKDETEKCFRKIQQCINEIEGTLTDKINTKSNLENLIAKQREDTKTVQQELQNVCEQLDNAKINKFTALRFTKETETLNTLQGLFSGVYGRLYTLCKPVHSRYQVAMTKVFGKYCNSIIVSTSRVAVQCIHYLKEQQIGIETFLPLEGLKTKPLKEELRGITKLQDVKLLYDVLQFAPTEIHNAIVFVCKDTLICETAEDARIFAYELDPHYRYNCIALDGTYYRKDGIISGGQAELLQKAKIWDNQNLIDLKSRKITLREKLNEKLTISQTESEINTLDIQIHALTNRLNYCRLDLSDSASKSKIVTLHNEIQIIQKELTLVQNNVTAINEIMEEKNQDIRSVEESIINIQQNCIFSYSTFSNGILFDRLHQEQTIKTLELEEQYSRIKNLLDFEMSRDTESSVFKMEKNIKTAKDELEKVRQKEVLYKNDTEYVLNKLNNLKTVYNEAKINVTKQTEDINECRCKIGVIAKSIINAQKEFVIITARIEKKKTKCCDILRSMKMENIIIPLLTNDVINIHEDVQTSSTYYTSTNTEELHDIEILSRIDFSMLSEDIKIRVEEEIENSRSKLANEHLKFVIENLNKVSFEYQEAHKKVRTIKKQFEIVKQERYNRFVSCLEHITEELDTIYKCLVRDDSAHAILLPENHEEPYLGGLNYSCIMPGKRFQLFLNLSGGEKTLAALAFLFSIHSFRPAPFFVLDEIDAALDTINLRNVVHFVLSKKREMQFIIISLKQELCSHADALIGICCDFSNKKSQAKI
ncbi:PREDICTED: structural maintenance of chromosomes protein 1A-like [Habropoda laboriosa]|uniref:structural maintenance of chromosomes protein 1A-like n=1 Tax=Habropoda laboriosa TaxID=597456 RepID=UPI00083E3BA3|nr:PREDICTED: structural maintenance of chromosomes protein 1A-like [Habropoda laboriosa]